MHDRCTLKVMTWSHGGVVVIHAMSVFGILYGLLFHAYLFNKKFKNPIVTFQLRLT